MGSRVGTDTVYCPLPALLLWPTKHHLISPSFLQVFSSWLTVNISRTSVPNSWILNTHTDDLNPGIPSLAGLSPPASATHSHAQTVVTHSPDGYLTTSLSSNPQHPPLFPFRGWPCFLLQWGNWGSLKRTFKDSSFTSTDVPTSTATYATFPGITVAETLAPFQRQALHFCTRSHYSLLHSRKSIALGILPFFLLKWN